MLTKYTVIISNALFKRRLNVSESTPPKKSNQKKRKRVLLIVGSFFGTIAIGYFLYYFFYGQYYESTDDAYAKQNIVYITPQTSGVVDAVYVNATQYVKAGESLGKLDTRDARLAFDAAKSQLAQSVRKIVQLHAQRKEAAAAVALAKVQVEKTANDLKRYSVLAKNNAMALNKYKHLKYAHDAATANLHVIQKRLLSIEALVKDGNISQNPQVQSAVTALKRTYLNLKRCNIIAPLSGIVAKKNFSIGENVGLTSTLLAIVPQNGFWVDANFKETQLKNIRIGQKAKLYSDQYGKSVVFHGKISGIDPGTGAVFSLIPPQNATGNWIKIVQRVPVRIELDPKELAAHPLHVGSSMDVIVNTHDRSKQALYALKGAFSDQNESIKPYQNALKHAGDIAKQIITQNL
jgi:membrane fusion protein, multidrug efflux system